MKLEEITSECTRNFISGERERRNLAIGFGVAGIIGAGVVAYNELYVHAAVLALASLGFGAYASACQVLSKSAERIYRNDSRPMQPSSMVSQEIL